MVRKFINLFHYKWAVQSKLRQGYPALIFILKEIAYGDFLLNNEIAYKNIASFTLL